MVAMSMSRSGKSCSQSNTLSNSMPPRHALSLLLPSPTRQLPPHAFCPTVSHWLVRTNCLLHLLHCSTNILPCNSATCWRFNPDFKWSPSMFWVIIYLIWPLSTNARNAMCVRVGMASLNSTLIVGFSPFSSRVQTPLGPLFYEWLWQEICA